MGSLGLFRQHPSDVSKVRTPDVRRRGWENVVPDCGEAAEELWKACGTSEEPPVEMFATITPPADVNSTDLTDRPHRSFHLREENPELCGKIVGEIARLCVMLARLEQNDDGKTVGFPRRP